MENFTFVQGKYLKHSNSAEIEGRNDSLFSLYEICYLQKEPFVDVLQNRRS